MKSRRPGKAALALALARFLCDLASASVSGPTWPRPVNLDSARVGTGGGVEEELLLGTGGSGSGKKSGSP